MKTKFLIAAILLAMPAYAQTVVPVMPRGVNSADLLNANGVLNTDARLGGNLITVLSPSGGDDTPQFTAACNAIVPGGSGVIRLNAGLFTAASPWVCAGRSVMVEGAGEGVSVLVATHTGVALTLAPSDVKQQVTVHNLTISGGASCATALGLLIQYPTGVSSYLQRTARVRDVDLVSDQATSAPGCHPNSILGGVQIVGTWNATLDNVHHTGPAALPPVAGTYTVSLIQNIDIKLNDVSSNLADRAIAQTGYNEGVKLSHLTCLATNYCSSIVGTGTVGGYNANFVTMTDTDCDTFVSCVDWTGVFEGYVHDNRFASRTAVATPLVHLVDTTKVLVHENGLNGAADSQQVGVSVEAGSLAHGTLNRVSGNLCTNLALCGVLAAGTSLNTVVGNAYPSDFATPTNVRFTDAGSSNFVSWVAGPGSIAQVGGQSVRGAQGQMLVQVPDVTGATSWVLLGAAGSGGSPSIYGVGAGATNLNVAGAGGYAVVGPLLPCAGAPSTILCSAGSGQPAHIQ